MKKYAALSLIFVFLIIGIAACAPLKKPMDNRVHFSQYLQETEQFIRQEEWTKAFESLEKSQKAWSKIKPILQVDIDHDYVNDIENYFTVLKGYLETKEKPDSLANILLLQKSWANIGEM